MSIECPQCKEQNPDDKKYCGDCGSTLQSTLDPLKPELRQYVRSVISEELKDRKVAEVEMTEAIVTRLSTWAKLFGYFVGIPFAVVLFVLGFLGYKSYSDFSGLITAAEVKIRPTLTKAQEQADDIKKQADDIQQKADLLKVKYQKLEALDQEVGNLNAKVNQIAEKIDFKPSAELTKERENQIKAVLDSYQEYLQKIGYQVPQDKSVSLEILPDKKAKCISCYDGNTMILSAAYADDTDYALREFTNHVLDSVSSVKFPFEPQRKWTFAAIASGLAAYLPCSFNGKDTFGEKSQKLLPRVRSWHLVNDRKFRDLRANNNSAQEDGAEIWGGVFWEIRQALTRDLTDKLLFSTWNSLQPADFTSDNAQVFGKKLLEIDQSLEGGAHAIQIRSIFNRRGLSI